MPRNSAAFSPLYNLPRLARPHSIHVANRIQRGQVRTSCVATNSGVQSKATTASRAAPTSAYIHLPFCVQRCLYCSFTVTVSQNEDTHERYLDTLLREIRAHGARRAATAPPLQTVYLGGGTPSVLSGEQISRVLTTTRDALGVADDAEVTAEMDPATFDDAKASAFLEAGVNRVSVGVQSTHDAVLATCGRVHRRVDVFNALDALRRAGVDNVSVDLMTGLPGLTVPMLDETLADLLPYSVQHVSVYDLQLEPGTAFGRRYRAGVAPLPPERDSVRMLRAASDALGRAGFERYEVSNYARDGCRSRHNMAYWRAQPFYAFGVGATSLSDGVRFARPKVMTAYRKYVEQLEENSGDTSVLYPGTDVCSDKELLEDYLINRFRLLVEGVPLGEVADLFSTAVVDRLLESVSRAGFLNDGLVEVMGDGEDRCVRLTEKGAMIEISVLATVLQDVVWDFHDSAQRISSDQKMM